MKNCKVFGEQNSAPASIELRQLIICLVLVAQNSQMNVASLYCLTEAQFIQLLYYMLQKYEVIYLYNIFGFLHLVVSK